MLIPNITDVTQKRLCCNVLGEDVGRVVNGRIDLDNPSQDHVRPVVV